MRQGTEQKNLGTSWHPGSHPLDSTVGRNDPSTKAPVRSQKNGWADAWDFGPTNWRTLLVCLWPPPHPFQVIQSQGQRRRITLESGPSSIPTKAGVESDCVSAPIIQHRSSKKVNPTHEIHRYHRKAPSLRLESSLKSSAGEGSPSQALEHLGVMVTGYLMSAKRQTAPTLPYPLNGFENLKGKTARLCKNRNEYQSQNPTRDHL